MKVKTFLKLFWEKYKFVYGLIQKAYNLYKLHNTEIVALYNAYAKKKITREELDAQVNAVKGKIDRINDVTVRLSELEEEVQNILEEGKQILDK